MKQKVDKETAKLLSDGEKIEGLVNSDGWRMVKRKLMDKLILLDSISSIPDSVTDKVKEMQVRQGVVSIILEWIKEIEGIATQLQNNKQTLEDARRESIIQVFGDQ